MNSYLRKGHFSCLRFFLPAFCVSLFLISCSNGAVGPMGGPNAAAPGMSTGVSAPAPDRTDIKAALVLEGDVNKNTVSQDPNSKPYRTHMKGNLGCDVIFQKKHCYVGRVLRMIDPDHLKFLEIKMLQDPKDADHSYFDITFDSELPNLDPYRFFATPPDHTPLTEPPLSLATCPDQTCGDPDWGSITVSIQSQVEERGVSPDPNNLNPVKPSSQTY